MRILLTIVFTLANSTFAGAVDEAGVTAFISAWRTLPAEVP